MTTFICHVCNSYWQVGPTRDISFDEYLCHKCLRVKCDALAHALDRQLEYWEHKLPSPDMGKPAPELHPMGKKIKEVLEFWGYREKEC